MIYTVYLNPTIDKTVYLDRLEIGGTNRPDTVLTQGGGKALNLAIVASRLGAEASVCGFLCQEGCEQIRSALAGLPCYFTELPGQPRTNTKIYERDAARVTELNESGPLFAPEAYEAFEQDLLSRLCREDLVVLTGSLPRGCAPEYYGQLIRKLPCPAALDASGAALLPGVAAGPMVIKPNTDELTQLTGKTFHSTQDILAACRQIIEGGVSVCAVSMGKEGALITDGSKAFFAGSVVENPDSTVGAGDSMLAGILSVITRGGAIDEALRVGSAAAAATISLPGTNLATPKLIQEFLAKVTTTELEF